MSAAKLKTSLQSIGKGRKEKIMALRFRKVFLLGLVAAALWATVSAALAQRQDGTISGTVKDPSGAVVGNAAVTITSEQTGQTRSVMTSNIGFYTAPNLLVGIYTVKVEATGFAPYTRTSVGVQAAQTTEVNADLSVGATSETVQVDAGADLVQIQTSQLTKSFDEKMVAELPTVAGTNTSVLNLAIFLPNTTTAIGGTSGSGGSIGGTRGRQNSFTVDGVNNTNPSTTTVQQQVIPDAVQEFSLGTTQFSAEFGSAAGGQFNVVTKRGTNQLHGGAWWYNNNRNYISRSNLSDSTLPKPRYDFNRAGGNLGGRIIPNRLFIYGAYEYQTLGRAVLGTEAILPTAAGLQTLKSLAVNDSVRTILNSFPTAPTQSLTTPVTVGSTTTQIPLGRLSLSAPDYRAQHDYLVNTDMNAGAHSLRGGYISTRRRSTQNPPLPQPEFTALTGLDYKKITFSDIWVVNNQLVNELRSSYNRMNNNNPLSGGAAAYPNVLIAGTLGVEVGPNSNFPQGSILNQYQILEQLNYLKGRHSLKVGFEYRWYNGYSNFLQNSRGYYQYSSLSNLLNDQVPANQQLQGIGSAYFPFNAPNVAAFFQDDFKLTPRLTVNAGLRYEWFGNPAGARRNVFNSMSNLPGTELIWAVPKEDKNNFSPRLGFAWDMFGDSKWALRGGFGVAYDVMPFNFHMNGQPPQQQTILQASGACAGLLAAPPSWCASYLANGIGSNFLAGGAMKLVYRPPSDQATARSMTNQLLADTRNPKTLNWALGIQHELFKDTTVEIRYLGTRGLFLPVQIQLNTQTAFERGGRALPTYFSTSDVPKTVAADAPTQAQFLAARGRPYSAQGFTQAITRMEPRGVSEYHGGAVDFNRRFSRGLLFRANYTFAKTMDNSTNDLATSVVNPRRPQNVNNLRDEWGRSTLDIRHKLALMWVYEVPNLNVDYPVIKNILHGWQWNGTYLFQSGQPMTLQSAADANGNSDTAGDRVILNPSGTEGIGTAVQFVCRNADSSTRISTTSGGCGSTASIVGYVAANPSARYVQAQVGAQANVGRNTVDAKPFNVWNLSLVKNNRMGEGRNLQFRMEIFNVFNTANYALGYADVGAVVVSTNASSQSYANVTSANFLNEKQFDRQGRSMQLVLKLSF